MFNVGDRVVVTATSLPAHESYVGTVGEVITAHLLEKDYVTVRRDSDKVPLSFCKEYYTLELEQPGNVVDEWE